jgi:hypothetical protein
VQLGQQLGGEALDSPRWQPVRWNGLAAAAALASSCGLRAEGDGVSGNLWWEPLHMLKTASGRPRIVARLVLHQEKEQSTSARRAPNL